MAKRTAVYLSLVIILASMTACNIVPKVLTTTETASSGEGVVAPVSEPSAENTAAADSKKQSYDNEGLMNPGSGGENNTVPENFDIGSAAGRKYTNPYIGLGCELNSDWTFYNRDEILSMNGLVKETTDEELAQQLKNQDVIFIMFAAAETSINYKEIKITLQNIGNLSYTEDKTFFDVYITQLTHAIKNRGYTVDEDKSVVTQFAGADRNVIRVKAPSNGSEIYKEIILIKIDNIVCYITLSSYDVDDLDDMEGYFYSVK